jgi:hypothetical protein
VRFFRRSARQEPAPARLIGTPRPPTDAEKWLICEVAQLETGSPAGWVEELTVTEMNDGGMGSLMLHPEGVFTPWEARAPGVQVGLAGLHLRDSDGTPIDYRTMERIGEWSRNEH